MKHVSFRLAWVLVTLVLAGCSVSPSASPTATVVMSSSTAISVAIASNDFAVGSPRLPFVLFQGSKPLADGQEVQVTAFDLSTGTPVPGWSGGAISYSDYDVPYWVVYPEIPVPGNWGMVAVIKRIDGSESSAQFVITVAESNSAPALGNIPPPSNNRTLVSEPDLAKLTSDPEPEVGLYQLTVAEALKLGKPTVVTFATPAFCESRLCAPVVDSVKAVYRELKGSVSFIHIEVYKTFNPLVYADEMDEWGLTSEPWTFTLDRSGKIVARLGGPVSARELRAVLAPLVAP